MNAAQSELDRFRTAVLRDAVLQKDLLVPEDTDEFVARALAGADRLGIGLSAEELRSAVRPDPLGLSRWSIAPATDDVPQPGWLPIQTSWLTGQLSVDWAFFGERRLSEPFFEESVRRALERPLNRLARYRTFAEALPTWAQSQSWMEPSGFIFHMSRCGSTLLSQMLAADPRNVVISEAGPLDSTVQIELAAQGSAGGARGALLTAMVRALCQKRADPQCRSFVKLDSWHTLALPLFRHAFPSVPWVFLYREPAAVLASQLRERGIQTMPQYLPPSLFGLNPEDDLPPEDYCAQVLNKTCQAVLQPYSDGGGLLVNYDQLPQALWTTILPHFGIACGEHEREAMADAALYDSKARGAKFAVDPETERRAESSRPIADRYLGDVYRELEGLRLAAYTARGKI